MGEFRFKVDGLSETDARKWRKSVRPRSLPYVAAVTLSLVAIVYAIRHSPPPESVTYSVVQTIPPKGSVNVPVCAPCVFFLNRAYSGNIEFALSATDPDGKTLDLSSASRLLIVKSNAGNPIVILAPGEDYPNNSRVSADLRIRNLKGVEIFATRVEFSCSESKSMRAARLAGKELEQSSVSGEGDFGINAGEVMVQPWARSTMLALSTGAVLGGSALAGTTSLITLGPLELDSERLQVQFSYDFISSEFDEYVGTQYDDAFLIVMSGPKGAKADLVTSINRIGKTASAPVMFPPMPEGNELPPQHTGWKPYRITANVGSPACVTFMLTDVGDAKYTSLVTLDELEIR